MKTYELHAHPALLSVVSTQRPRPPLATGQIRVAMHAASLNYRDLLVAKSAQTAGNAKPIVPLSDGAGQVVEVGPGCVKFAVGDRVMAAFFPDWQHGILKPAYHATALGGGTADGVLSEQVVLAETAWVKIPDYLSYEEASCLPCAGLTAYHALFEVASLQAGQTVLIQGTGGVSSMAMQLAKVAGATSIVTTSNDHKGIRAKLLGAAHIINYKDVPDWGQVAYQLAGEGVDAVVEVGGPGTLDQSVQSARTGGTIAVVGVLTGFTGSLSIGPVLQKMVNIKGVYVGSVTMFEAFARLLTVHRIAPVIDRVFAFDQAPEAYQYLENAGHVGKVVITIDR